MSGGKGRRLHNSSTLAVTASPQAGVSREGAEAGGRLALVVGPSGAGKDTLISAARVAFANRSGISFCERYITRADQTGERHRALSEVEFSKLLRSGGFFLSWRAHGLSYGIGLDVRARLEAGDVVVVNASRGIVEAARQRWARTLVIHITASPEVRRERLLRRGRESSARVAERLRRAGETGWPPEEGFIGVDNSGALAESVARFNAVLAGLLSGEAAHG